MAVFLSTEPSLHGGPGAGSCAKREATWGKAFAARPGWPEPPDLAANCRLGRDGRLSRRSRLNRPCRPSRQFAAKFGAAGQTGPASLAANRWPRAPLPLCHGSEKHTKIMEYFPEAGFDVLPAIPGHWATSHYAFPPICSTIQDPRNIP